MNKILLITSILSFNLFASEPGATSFGRIVDIKGDGFISYEGKTKEIRKGDVLENGAEIIIEHRGQISFTDNADHKFHLGNSSSASVKSNIVELRSGDLWFQSLNKNDASKIQTVNAAINYQGGEGIVTYDSAKGKTQLMVINGIMKFSNSHTPDLNLSVSEGLFSFVENTYDEGAPRDPTPVGEKTYVELVALFKGVSPMDKNSAEIFKDHHANGTALRSVASVKEVTKGGREQTSEVDAKLIEKYKEEYKEKLFHKTTKKKKAVVSATTIKNTKELVHVYGQVKTPMAKTRAPASVIEQDVPPAEKAITKPIATPYSNEYKKENKESDKLIDELKKI